MRNQDFQSTQNNHGVMHKNINPISQAFIDYSINCSGAVLYIGSAYGVAAIPILENSQNIHVIACDISKEHLNQLISHAHEIELRTGHDLSHRITLIHKKFPDFELEILPFLTGKEIELGIQKIHQYLKSGGKFFALSYTIYNKVMKNYIPIYEERKNKGESWPGEVADASLFLDNNNPLTNILPKKLNHLEPYLLESILKKYDFFIEFLDFISLTDEIPDEIRLNGKEVVGLIATKR